MFLTEYILFDNTLDYTLLLLFYLKYKFLSKRIPFPLRSNKILLPDDKMFDIIFIKKITSYLKI